jgi:hypothetical protein
MGNRTRDLPACSIVPQPTTLPHTHLSLNNYEVECIVLAYHRVKWGHCLNNLLQLLVHKVILAF